MTLQTTDQQLIDIFKQTKTIAMIGASLNPARASFRVGNYLADLGYKVIPINPGHVGEILFGQPIVASFKDIPSPQDVDMVDIFRKSEFIADIVDDAMSVLPNLQTIWMQLELRNETAAQKASDAGIMVVQDKCPKIEYPRLQGLALV